MENLGVTEVMVLVLGIMGLTLGAFGFKAFVDVHHIKKELQLIKDEIDKQGNTVLQLEEDD